MADPKKHMAAIPTVNKQIAKKFYTTAALLKAKGEKYLFRSLAYFKAAETLEQLEKGVDEIYKKSWLVGLQKISGIGNRLAHDIERELLKRGVNRK